MVATLAAVGLLIWIGAKALVATWGVGAGLAVILGIFVFACWADEYGPDWLRPDNQRR
jgi:hypothetical protein